MLVQCGDARSASRGLLPRTMEEEQVGEGECRLFVSGFSVEGQFVVMQISRVSCLEDFWRRRGRDETHFPLVQELE